MSSDPYQTQQHRPTDRGTYVPSWGGDVNADLDAPVASHDGVLQGYKRGDVLPEKRWAVRTAGPDGMARMLAQGDFTELYQRYASFCVNSQGKIVPIETNIGNDPLPRVENWVRKAIDQHGRSMLLGQKKPLVPRPEVPEVMFDSHGENPVPTIEAIAADVPTGIPASPDQIPLTSGSETAPCGKEVRQNYLKQHIRFCKEEACNKKE